jgi:uncharacterized protein YraI
MPLSRPDISGLSARIRVFLWTLLVIAMAGGATVLSATAANAAQAFATANVNLRAGPGTDYPVVTTLSAGQILTIYGCLSDGSWCDVATGGDRGWVSNNYLSSASNSHVGLGALALPAVIFSYTYWDNYYARRPWYNTWWGHGRPRPPHYHRPGYRPGMPGVRPPHQRPPHVRPPGVRPPGVKPPHFRPPHGTKPSPRPGNRPHLRPGRPGGNKRPVILPRGQKQP